MHFPQFFDKNNDFKTDKFLEELKANTINEVRDGYKLGFIGKDYARLQTGQVSETLVVPDCGHNDKEENKNSGNIFITGDNLEALRHLRNAYANKIKMIYIDPPYNTGSRDFTYSDKFEFDDEKLKSALNYNDDEMAYIKSIHGKSSHSAWLTFMYPRLKLVQKLLTDDGVIFVSIDDNEQANLKLLMDDVFGEGNFIAEFPRLTVKGGKTQTETSTSNCDYLYSYAKNISEIKFNKIGLGDDPSYKFVDEHEAKRGKYHLKQALDTISLGYIQSLDYPIEYNGKTYYPGGIKENNGYRWTWSKQKYEFALKNDFIVFKGNRIFPKKYIHASIEKNSKNTYFIEYLEKAKNYSQLHFIENIFSNTHGNIDLKNLKISDLFLYPKPVNLICEIIKMACDKNAIILDFFAGSGTTAHAVMKLNAEDGGNRKFILVQLDEQTNHESEARKAGYNTIDEIARERIKRAAQKIKSEAGLNAQNLDCGFKHFRLKYPDVRTIDKIIDFDPSKSLFDSDMITPFAYPQTQTSGLDTLLATWLIDDGFTFDTHVENIEFARYEAHYVKEAAVVYLINQGWDLDALKSLLNKIGKNELFVNTIIVYPYSFSFAHMRELKTNVKTNLDNPPTILERY
ncbi:MAG: site-specific DNA-methyltransferase [Campylobacteraceae bacterium]|jgi:adenine specific DNA methylase Mod|nr:site-specific DNA-methyltransferase [Campylobacteraceae bacterium]